MAEFKLPTEVVELPSKGLLYSKESPLSEGKVEIKYMTAKEEDILTNQSYIEKGTVIDKLLESLVVTKINFNDLLIGDKNALMVSARVLGYGKNYKFEYNGEEYEVDLSQIGFKEFDESNITKGNNEFQFTLPNSENLVTFKLLTQGDEKKISTELEGLKRLNKDFSPEISTRLKYLITSVNGDREKKTIREFVDNYLLAQDARALREHIRNLQPDIDLTFFPSGSENKRSIPIGVSFFYPDITTG